MRSDCFAPLKDIETINCQYFVEIHKSAGRYEIVEYNEHEKDCLMLAKKHKIPQELSPEMDAWLLSVFKAGLTIDQVALALSVPQGHCIFDTILHPPRPECMYEKEYVTLRRFNPTPPQLHTYKSRIKRETYYDAADENDTIQFLRSIPGLYY